MRPILTFTISPSLPPELEDLRELAMNLRWSWNHETIALFRRLDSDLWEVCNHNPVRMLGNIDQKTMIEAVADEAFLAHLSRVKRDHDQYMAAESSWYKRKHGVEAAPITAYFSAEFGLTECLSIFAGGLGILAGDHLKSASDLGVPLVGVGLLYQQGYFRQFLNQAGWQQEDYAENEFHNLPLTLELRADGQPYTVTVNIGEGQVAAQLWRVQVGRIRLYLLDTNIPSNPQAYRDLTDQLYGGNEETRIKQEILLGIGGYQALRQLGIRPDVYHMNEGHSAFLAVEHVRTLMREHSLSFAEARELASAGLVFTTHTPVPAGHDYFTGDLVQRYLGKIISDLGITFEQFMGLGRREPSNVNESFCMTVLALRLASGSNGVSELHGKVSRQMWQGLWPGLPEDEIPIGHVTNGVHFRSWISHDLVGIYDRYLVPRWREEPSEPAIWARVWRVPAEELWRTHERRRERLVAFARRRLHDQLSRRGASPGELEFANEVLNPEALTIGFGRRFAEYKRAVLLLRDRDRLDRILNNPHQPVQVIYTGKAHPRDNLGKDLIKQIVSAAREPRFRQRIVFLEDYDMAVARYLVQGVDLWLNVPRRPREASGTSGMKAAANGVLNLSTLDGWWDEAWLMAQSANDPIGWAVGRGESYPSIDEQDSVEALALYDVLEREVVPMFYERGSDGLPRRWINSMKASISSLCHFFNTHRMVREYTELFYHPAASATNRLLQNGARQARDIAAWKLKVFAGWKDVNIVRIETDSLSAVKSGDSVTISAWIKLGNLSPADVQAELLFGRVDAKNEINNPVVSIIESTTEIRDGAVKYQVAAVPCCYSGLHGFTIRIRPWHPDLPGASQPPLILWAKE